MRILHVGKHYPPHTGGMETVLENIAQGLLHEGDDVAVLAASPDAVRRRTSIGDPDTGRRGILVLSACPGQWNSQPLTWDLVRDLRDLLREFSPHIVHLHLPNPLGAGAWLAWAAWAAEPRPTLAVWHHADMVRQKLGGRLVRPLVRKCLGQAAGICVSSAALAGASTELKGLSDRVEVIPFGIAPPAVTAPADRGPDNFLFVGRLVAYKGVSVLVEAMARVPAARLQIVGEGPRRRSLQEQVTRLGLDDRITFAGEVSPLELAARLAGARALVLPSVDGGETFGLVQLEAMAAGKAVIASDLPSGVSQVGEAGRTAILVPPRDVTALAEALARIQADPELARRMGDAGRQRYQEHFTRSRMIADLRGWYRRLLHEGPEGN